MLSGIPRKISEFGGLWLVMPVYTATTLIVVLSSLGLPGLNGFVGEFVILLGSMEASHYGLAIYGFCNDGGDLSGRLPAVDVPTSLYGSA